MKSIKFSKKLCWKNGISCLKNNHTLGRLMLTLVIFLVAFYAGKLARKGTQTITATSTLSDQVQSWGLGGYKEGAKPSGCATAEELKKYNCYYVGEGDEKVLYLTFDAGYENGNTEPILNALRKHNAKATFFVVGHYLDSAPELIKRMVNEGHTVGNHTLTHPSMSSIQDKEAFKKELDGVEKKYKELTGLTKTKFYRPPRGEFSKKNLEMAKEMGYETFFWSMAYVDWNVDSQPSKEEAFDKMLGRVHPGAIVLLHSTSKTNGEILDELLTKWEEMGYHFSTLEDLVKK